MQNSEVFFFFLKHGDPVKTGQDKLHMTDKKCGRQGDVPPPATLPLPKMSSSYCWQLVNILPYMTKGTLQV